MLAAGKGTELKAIASGNDAETALEELSRLFASKFDEK
ncbi:MAG: HPr family phosphocarrier protein [Opitutales bacterium]|nr:HPr family phosphocarrier protein [Opitutales bacterium]